MPNQGDAPAAAARAGLPAEAAALLDNPIWHALRTEHEAIALGDGRARRYPSHIGPLAGIPVQGEENYAALGALAGDDVVVLFSLEPYRVPEGWTELRMLDVVQMVRWPELADEQSSSPISDGAKMHRLTANDAPAMVALAEMTEPGPFRLRTLELGGFYGIFEGDRLVAMAGRRMHLPGLIEVSGVCTHPDARGRGYARRLMTRVIGEIEREGKTAFLHALESNPAIRIYQRLGFRWRRMFRCAVLKQQL
ncbi:MAG: GNAT family N-acetyltransferase [Terracidiphilus sp.]